MLHDRTERRLDLVRLEPHLGVREAQGREAGARVSLIAATVHGLLRGRAVIAEAVGLDDEAEIGPVEVHSEAVEADLGLRWWEAGSPSDGDEAALELRVSEEQGGTIEAAAEGRKARPSRHAAQRRPQGLRVDQFELVGFVDRRLELGGREPGCEIDEGEGGARDGDAVMPRDIGRPDSGSAVDDDAGGAGGSWGGDGDVDEAFAARPDAKQGSSGVVAQNRALAAGENGCHPPAELTDLRASDRIHAREQLVKAAGRQPVLDGVVAVPKGQELEPGDDTVLGPREPPGPPTPSLRIFPRYSR